MAVFTLARDSCQDGKFAETYSVRDKNAKGPAVTRGLMQICRVFRPVRAARITRPAYPGG